ncbi:MAG: hypothetical protein F4Y49_07580 [Dehalococcoidia bacterium]|nr:hypothetical protein [Dehalococcoidia bacterium]
MRVGIQDIAEQLAVLLARAALGLFLAGVFGLGLYILLLPVVQSFWQIKDINFALLGVLTVGFGAGVGSFLAWLNRDLHLSKTLLILFLSIVAATIGAWIGLHENRDAFKLGGMPGIPALTGIVIGAILGANLLNVPIWIAWSIRNPRI